MAMAVNSEGLVKVRYTHVHNCGAGHEERPCLFEWRAHAESQLCACGPRVDETNLSLDGRIFVVHQGVC